MKAGDSTVQFSDLFPTEYRAFYRGALSVCVEHFGGIDSKKSVPYSDALHRKNASCRTVSPAAVQLRKLVAAGEIPDTAYACIAVIHSKKSVSFPFPCLTYALLKASVIRTDIRCRGFAATVYPAWGSRCNLPQSGSGTARRCRCR